MANWDESLLKEGEYERRKLEIIKQHGQDLYDGQNTPSNLSAKLIRKLSGQRAQAVKHAKARQRLEEADLGEIVPNGKSLTAHITEDELSQFSDQERLIIRALMQDPDQDPKEVALRVGGDIKFQAVARFMASDRFKLWYNQFFDRLCELKVRVRHLRAVDKGGLITETMRAFGLMKNEAIDVNLTETIHDAGAEQALKDLAYQLCGRGQG